MFATQFNPNQPNQCLTASPVRARERQIRAPKQGILGFLCRVSYWDNVTVYPYNRYITGTNLHTTLKHLRAGTSNAVNKAVQAQLSCSVFICHWCRYQKVLETYLHRRVLEPLPGGILLESCKGCVAACFGAR